MLEYEKKIMLTEEEYTALVTMMCKFSPLITQTNYYFDTDDLSMNRKGITCRIREKNGKFKLTVKRHNAGQNDCSIEEGLSEKTELDSKLFDALGLSCQGKLITERIVVYKDSSCETVIDRNTYLGKIDYELETEYKEGCEKKAQYLLHSIADALVASYTITDKDEFFARIGQGKTKSQRFFERKSEKGGKNHAVNFE